MKKLFSTQLLEKTKLTFLALCANIVVLDSGNKIKYEF